MSIVYRYQRLKIRMASSDIKVTYQVTLVISRKESQSQCFNPYLVCHLISRVSPPIESLAVSIFLPQLSPFLLFISVTVVACI